MYSWALASACLEDAFFPVTGLRMVRLPAKALRMADLRAAVPAAPCSGHVLTG